jgi:hypothetical protein
MSWYTEGPWETVDRADNVSVKAGSACVCRLQKTGAPYWANARIIAAAPAMMEALLRLEKRLGGTSYSVELGIVQDALAKVKA